MNNIKISVIVPVYNTEKYLRRCLDSIINQNFREIEIIIVNDCSTDNSLKIINDYIKQDDRIILINKEKNKGLSAARNSGIGIARGEYIAHIDSDDWIEQNYFKDMYEYAIKNEAEIVISDFYKDFDNGQISYMKDQEKNIENVGAIKNIFLFRAYPCVWNKIIKAELYKGNDIFHPEGISIGEDLCTSPKLMFFAKKIMKHDKAYYHYIQNPKSMMREKTQNLNKIKEIYSVVKNLEEFFISKNIVLPINELKINHLSIWLLKSEYSLNDLEYLEILDEYVKLFKKVDLNIFVSKKIIFFGKILKIFNKRIIFIVLWHFNSIFEYLRR